MSIPNKLQCTLLKEITRELDDTKIIDETYQAINENCKKQGHLGRLVFNTFRTPLHIHILNKVQKHYGKNYNGRVKDVIERLNKVFPLEEREYISLFDVENVTDNLIQMSLNYIKTSTTNVNTLCSHIDAFYTLYQLIQTNPEEDLNIYVRSTMITINRTIMDLSQSYIKGKQQPLFNVYERLLQNTF